VTAHHLHDEVSVVALSINGSAIFFPAP